MLIRNTRVGYKPAIHHVPRLLHWYFSVAVFDKYTLGTWTLQIRVFELGPKILEIRGFCLFVTEEILYTITADSRQGSLAKPLYCCS